MATRQIVVDNDTDDSSDDDMYYHASQETNWSQVEGSEGHNLPEDIADTSNSRNYTEKVDRGESSNKPAWRNFVFTLNNYTEADVERITKFISNPSLVR